MSGPVSSGESLEAILASIRRSLAEQATDALDEEAPAPPEARGDLETPPFPDSVSQQLGGAAQDASLSAQTIASAGDPQSDAADLGEAAPPEDEPLPAMFASPSPAPASAAAPQSRSAPGPQPSVGSGPAARAQKAPQQDPLWFLGQETAQKAQAAGPAAPQKAAGPAGEGQPPVGARPVVRAPEPKPPRAGVVRGPLPPFFGSSAETVKVEIAPDPPVLPGAGTVPPAPPSPPEAARVVNGEARRSDGVEHAQAANGQAMPPRPADGLLNGKASALFGPAPADARAAGAEASAQMQALEVMVAELLRPMLRRWLDENMPRLVSAALKAEAQLMSERDRKKP